MREPSRRVQFLTDLASVVDRDTDAELRHGDLLASNAAVAALREEVETLAATLGQAGADFVPSIDFQRRLQEELSARREGRPHRQDSQELTVPTLALPEFTSDPPPAASENPLAVVDFGSPPPEAIPTGPKPRSARRGAHPVWIFTLLLTIAVAGALALAGPGGRDNLAAHMENAAATVGAWFSPAAAPQPAPKATPAAPLSRVVIEQVVGPAEELQGLGDAPARSGTALPVGIPIVTGPRSQLSIRTEGGTQVTLGPQSQVTATAAGQLSLRGAASVELGPEETSLALPNANLVGHGAALLIQADEVQSQVAVLRGQVRIDPPQAQALVLNAFQMATLSPRGAPVVAPVTDPRPFLAAVASPEATPGQLAGPDHPQPTWPTRHDVAIELQADLALITVTEHFAPAGGSSRVRYTLPMPPFASLVEAPQVLSGATAGEPESAARSTRGAELQGLNRDGGPLRMRTRYLLPVMRDGRGAHLRYTLGIAQGAPPLTVGGEASLLESGTLRSTTVPKGPHSRRLELADTRVDRALQLRIDVTRPEAPQDGRVIWASASGPLNTGEHWEPGSDAHDHAAALVRLSPLEATVQPVAAPQLVVLVDHSRAMAAHGATVEEVLEAVRRFHDPATRLLVRYCQLECTVDGPSTAPAGSFDLAAALHSVAPELQPPPAGPVHVLVVTDGGPSAGDLELPAGFDQASLSSMQLGPAEAPELSALVRTRGGLQVRARGPLEAQEGTLQWLRSFFVARGQQARLALSSSEHGRAGYERELATLVAGSAEWVAVPGRIADGATAQLYANLGEGQAPLTRDYVLGHYPPSFASSPFNALLRWQARAPQAPGALSPPMTALGAAEGDTLAAWATALQTRVAELAPAARRKRPQILRPERLPEVDLSELNGDQAQRARAICATESASHCLAALEAAPEREAATSALRIEALARSGLREAAWAELANRMDAYANDAVAQHSYAQLLLQAGRTRAGCSHARRARTLDPSRSLPSPCLAGGAPAATETANSAPGDDLRVSARWAENDAFDLVLTDMHGRSLSWLSPLAEQPLGQVVDPFAQGRETLTIENLPSGLYQLTLVATEQSGEGGPQTVRVEVQLGKERRVFSLHPEVAPGGQTVAFLHVP